MVPKEDCFTDEVRPYIEDIRAEEAIREALGENLNKAWQLIGCTTYERWSGGEYANAGRCFDQGKRMAHQVRYTGNTA